MPLRQLAERLGDQGFSISPGTLSSILKNTLSIGRRKIEKRIPLGHSADRAEQFDRLQELRREYAEQDWPVVSVDTKKKELLGQYAHDGQAWTNGCLHAFDHDFGSYSNGKAIPYGVYDTARNEAFVYLATGSDTGELAADALRRWWYRLGQHCYRRAGGILVLADCGGSNGYHVALYREQLHRVANRIGIPIRVAHLPPYCSKYNPIDHRLFCHLTRAIRGRLCETLSWMQSLFSGVTTKTGLNVVVELARKTYEAGCKASDEFRQCETTLRDERLGKYNYVLPVAK